MPPQFLAGLILSLALVAVALPTHGQGAPADTSGLTRIDNLQEALLLKSLREAADAGDALSAEQAADVLVRGASASPGERTALEAELKTLEGRAPDPERRQSSDLDRMQAIVQLLNQKPDVTTAKRYYAAASNAGRMAATLKLADLYLRGAGAAPDSRTARDLYALGFAAGDALSAHMLAVLAELGEGGPRDLDLAQRAHALAAAAGDRRSAALDLDWKAAKGWAPEVAAVEALRPADTSAALRPAFSETGRQVRALQSMRLVVRDVNGRRRFSGRLEAGQSVAFAPDDATADVSRMYGIDSIDNHGPVARLAIDGTERILAPRSRETIVLSPALSDRPTWRVTAAGVPTRGFSLVSTDRAISEMIGENNTDKSAAVKAVEQSDLWLELRPGAEVVVTPPGGDPPWRLTGRSGEVLRVQLDASTVSRPERQAMQPTSSAPSEFQQDWKQGTPALRDVGGKIVGWSFRAEDLTLPGVQFPFPFHYPIAAMQAEMRGDAVELLRTASLWHRNALHREGPVSDDAIHSGRYLAGVLQSLGRQRDALRLANHWSDVARSLHGPRHSAVWQAALLRAEIDGAAGQLSSSAVEARYALAIAPLWSEAAFPDGHRPNNDLPRALQILADAYSAAGLRDQEAAVVRRMLLLDSVSDTLDRRNGSIDVYLRAARIASPGVARSAFAEVARRRAKADAVLGDVQEPLPNPLPPLPAWYSGMFGDPARSAFRARALQRLGEAYLLLDRPAEAVPLLDEALAIWDKTTPSMDRVRLRPLGILADAKWAMGDKAASVAIARRAADVALAARRDAVSADGAASLVVDASDAVERLLWMLRNGADASDTGTEVYALMIQVMRDDLGDAVRRASNPAVLSVVAELGAAQRAWRDALERKDEAAAVRYRDRIEALAVRRRELQPSPRLAALADVQPKDGEVRLLVWPARKSIFLFALTPKGPFFAAADRDAPAIRRDLAAFRVALTDVSKPFDVTPSAELGRALLRPIRDALAGARHIIVAADGAFRSVPFEAMRDETGWLIDRYVVSYVAGSQSSPASSGNAVTNRKPLLGIGNPVVGALSPPSAGPLEWLAQKFGWRAGLDPLPNAEVELEALRSLLGAQKSDLLTGGNATRKALTVHPNLGTARVVVFATHGLVAGSRHGPRNEPSLVLTPDPPDDGFLTASDIEQLRFGADVVILSACDTAAPDGSLGSAGLSGLARAFFTAGAGAVIATHWKVHDDAAGAFSSALIQAWKRGGTLAEAKTDAQRRLRTAARGRFAHPGYWASFVIVGEGGTKW